MTTSLSGPVALSLVDQAALSALNLGLNLAIIAWAEPSELGRYVFAVTLILILTSVQNALVATPVTVHLAGGANAEGSQTLARLLNFDRLYRLLAALAAAALAAVGDLNPAFLLVTAAATYLTLARETERAIHFAEQRAGASLALDSVMMAASVLATAALWPLLPAAAAAIGGIAIGNLAALLACSRRPWLAPWDRAALRSYRAHFKDTRWSLAGATTTELQNRFYVVALEAFRDLATLGTVQAGRLLLGPMPLVSGALGRVARPALARSIAAGEVGPVRRVMIHFFSAALATGLIYCAVLYALWPTLETAVFKGRYAGVGALTIAWGGCTIIGVCEQALAAVLIAAYRLKELATVTIGSAALSSALLMGLAFDVPPLYAVLSVAAGQALMLVWVAVLVRNVLRDLARGGRKAIGAGLGSEARGGR